MGTPPGSIPSRHSLQRRTANKGGLFRRTRRRVAAPCSRFCFCFAEQPERSSDFAPLSCARSPFMSLRAFFLSLARHNPHRRPISLHRSASAPQLWSRPRGACACLSGHLLARVETKAGKTPLLLDVGDGNRVQTVFQRWCCSPRSLPCLFRGRGVAQEPLLLSAAAAAPSGNLVCLAHVG